jgi:putative RecB family exonuclease
LPEVYSHSRLSSFEDCPRKFQYRYVLRIPSDSDSIEGFVGKRVHEVLERLYRVVETRGVPRLERVIQRFDRLWEEHYDPDRTRIVRNENDAEYYRSMGTRCLTNYYRRFYPFDGDETLGLEKRVAFDLDPDRRYRMQGFIDRLVKAKDGAIEIHDFKTSQRMPSQARLDDDRQLALYQIGVGRQYGEDRPVRLVWHYLQPNRSASSTRTPEQLEELRKRTMGLIDRIRAETEYEPRTGPLCRWCEYADYCPAVSDSPRPLPTAPAAATASPEPKARAAERRPRRQPEPSSDAPEQLDLL